MICSVSGVQNIGSVLYTYGPTLVFFPGESPGQRSLAGYSPWGLEELDMTERLSMSATYNIFFLGGRDFVCRRFGATEEVGGWGRAPGRVWIPPWVSVRFVGASYLGSKDEAGKVGR